MGAAASVEGWDILDEEKRKDLQSKFAALVESGKTEEQAIAELESEVPVPAKVDDAEAAVSNVEKIPLTDLVEAIDRAVKAGKTPLVVDRSEAGLVDTFYSYRSVQMLDAKKMGLDKAMKKVPVPDILEEARGKLVSALKLGFALVICMQTSVTDFSMTFNDESAKDALKGEEGQKWFPKEVFLNAGRSLVSDENLKALFREADLEHGIAMSREPENFHVIITTRFAPEDFEEYLLTEEWGLPRILPKEEQYQYIIIEHEEDTPLLT